METTAQSRTNHLETYFDRAIERLELVTSRNQLRTTLLSYEQEPTAEKVATMTSIIKAAKEPILELEQICVTDTNGIVVASTNEDCCGRDVHNKDFFLQAQEESHLFFVEEDGVRKLFAVGPFILDGQWIGVGITVVNMNELNRIVADTTGLGETGEVLIAQKSPEGEIVFLTSQRFESEAFLQTEIQSISPMHFALGGQETTLHSIDYRGKDVLATTQYLEGYQIGLVTKIDISEIRSSIYVLYGFMSLFSLLFIFIFFVASRYFALLITRPLSQLEKAAKEMSKGNLNYPINIKTRDEIDSLGHSFSQMAKALKKSFETVEEKVKEQTKQLEDQKKALMNVLDDVEEEKKVSEKRVQDLEKFRLAVENVSEHIVITDKDGMVLFMNKGAENITGFFKDEILGTKAGTKQNWGGQMPKEFYQTLWKQIKEEKKFFSGEIRNKRKDGSEYEASVNIASILNEKEEVQFLVGVERDITKAKEIDRMKSEFVSVASHQLRTPLSTIRWYGEMLLAGDAGKLKPEQNEFVHEMYDSSLRMIKLVNSLLNVSRIESGRIQINPQPTELKQLINGVLEALQKPIQEKQLIIIPSIHPQIGLLMIDPLLVREVFANLLTNAVKYTPEKGEIRIFVSQKREEILVQVSDTGYGIPKAQQNRVFKRFFRGDNIMTKEPDGTGLGLYITKAIVESSGGKIWFKTKENEGTTFWFTIPKKGMEKKEGDRTLASTELIEEKITKTEESKGKKNKIVKKKTI
ncbi:MAG: PAS/PAC sensor hybrid histidine kinase [Candidatus Uhrbacteria bacterium GW2011_GWE2_40_58]|nr:MAG: PAS/PAC sensor hybrid histidine kinase [Candidatus Uhrbacteria bacterium GW2011_GWF2_40_263]KKR67888.1 MAG: PAS/PAC sensor hybrid histidine kinase [Candidatus Uhrbacteria bacterium GW2011_GWE2_40_58]OGL96857.1 MAG: hypothetical protein A2332_01935 [Candidatus Uhrbacteria bacterium RIFOXYB2_FULL_41_18]HBK34547.1 hypothetical protein [Candidatus Uhrbacteria bacterium]HCB55898.1 hypothetical protein [Candidatus Uhrbacteria bacterium]